MAEFFTWEQLTPEERDVIEWASPVIDCDGELVEPQDLELREGRY